jgi:hypothetical protein
MVVFSLRIPFDVWIPATKPSLVNDPHKSVVVELGAPGVVRGRKKGRLHSVGVYQVKGGIGLELSVLDLL